MRHMDLLIKADNKTANKVWQTYDHIYATHFTAAAGGLEPDACYIMVDDVHLCGVLAQHIIRQFTGLLSSIMFLRWNRPALYSMSIDIYLASVTFV